MLSGMLHSSLLRLCRESVVSWEPGGGISEISGCEYCVHNDLLVAMYSGGLVVVSEIRGGG